MIQKGVKNLHRGVKNLHRGVKNLPKTLRGTVNTGVRKC